MGVVTKRKKDLIYPPKTMESELRKALRVIAEKPASVTPDTQEAIDRSLQSTDPHAPDRDWDTPFLYACRHGLAKQIWCMINAHGGPAKLADLPFEYLDACERFYYDSAQASFSKSGLDEGLRAWLENAAVEADSRANSLNREHSWGHL